MTVCSPEMLSPSSLRPLARQSEIALPDEETAAEMFEMTQDRLATAGLPADEISNHALGPNAGTTWPIGVTRTMPGSVPERMAA